MKNIGVYIHIPFCNNKCLYCDFYSKVSGPKIKADYVESVINSIKTQPFGELKADTLYFGGGTPSVLLAEDLSRIALAAMDKFNIDLSAEISLEANPESVSLEMLQALRKVGFNRVSFGVQSAVKKELTALGRIHDAETAKEAILNAKKAGFEHISADLMLGIPHQNAESISESIDFMTKLPLDHISAYMLGIEEGTPFATMGIEKYCLGEDEISQSYLEVVKNLEAKGFLQYEISNFAKAGGESLHNLKYWKTEEYLGIGPSAHSFINGKRFSIPSSVEDFIQSDGDWSRRNIDGNGGDYAEYGMLRLRLKEGLNLNEYKSLYPEINKDKIIENAKILVKEGYLEFDGQRLFFTPEGFLISNYLIAQLLF